MAFHCLAYATDLRLPVPPHSTYSLTLQLSVLSGLPFVFSPDLLDGVQGLLQNLRNLLDFPGAPRRQLSDTFRILVFKSVQSLSEAPESLGSPRLSASSRLYSWQRTHPGDGGNPAELVGWRHLMKLESCFQGSHGKICGRSWQTRCSRRPAVLDKSPATAYEYMVDIFSCTIAIGIPSLASRTKIEVSSVSDFANVKEHWGAFIFQSRAVRTNTRLTAISLPVIPSKSPRTIKVSLLEHETTIIWSWM